MTNALQALEFMSSQKFVVVISLERSGETVVHASIVLFIFVCVCDNKQFLF